jgi:hypothetical protein
VITFKETKNNGALRVEWTAKPKGSTETYSVPPGQAVFASFQGAGGVLRGSLDGKSVEIARDTAGKLIAGSDITYRPVGRPYVWLVPEMEGGSCELHVMRPV